MITNRTNEDVVEATQLLREKLQKNILLTETEKETVEKGLISIDTLNRIEEKQRETAELLNEMGYPCNVINRSWNRGDVFKTLDFQRIAQNHNKMLDAFVAVGAIALPMLYYQNLNTLEEYLVKADEIITDIEANYRICGDYECGG